MDSGFFNMTKKNIIKYIIFVVYVTALFTCFSHIYAIDDSLNITENSKVSEETYNMITSVISDIKSDINEIDKKLENLKKNEIYINYPAVRLNVDTPVFGLVDITNSKLKIKKDVSTSDIVDGYSIKDIIQSNKIRVPSFTSTSIVVITRQIDIDENMLVSDANTVLSKLLEYRSTVKDVNSFVDTEINKIISSYIDKTKKDKLSKIQKQLKNIEKYNKEMSNKINELSFVNYINISNIEEMQNTFYTRYLDLKEKAEYLDMGNEDLNSLVKYVQILEVDVVNFSYYIDLVYDDIDDIDNVSNDNILEMLTNIQNKMQNQIEYVTKYKDTSYYYETFNVSKEEDMVKYNTTSDDILNNMNQSLEAVSIYIEQVKNRTENSNEMNQLESNMSAKNSTIVSEVNRIYKDFLEKELDYIKDNIELLNSENTNNLELISKYTTIDIAQYINYTYKTLQESIDDIQNKCNENSNVCLENTINSYIKINTKLLKTNIDITKIYNDNISKYSNLDRSTK